MDMMKQFHTRENANKGTKIPLSLPDGTPTEHFIEIRGVDSDIFRRAKNEHTRKIIDIVAMDDKVESEAQLHRLKQSLIAHLVISWSFETEATVENITNFFIEAPHIAEMIDKLSANRAQFYSKK